MFTDNAVWMKKKKQNKTKKKTLLVHFSLLTNEVFSEIKINNKKKKT
jgi:hypothetical protein